MSRLLTNTPIPGQSLARAPDNRLPIEQPPEHAEMNETVGYIFDDLHSKDKLRAVTKLLSDGDVYVDALSSSYVEQGIINGKWTPDMAHLLVEPVIFIFMWIASQVGAEVKFRNLEHLDSSGLDVLEGLEAKELEEEVESLFTQEVEDGN